MITASCFYALLIWSVTVVSVVGDCPAGKKTDNAEGRCCAFPFVYGGVSYDSCTKVNHNRLWCSLTAVYSGQWANCVDPCTNNPCQNAGTCTVTGDDSYSCQCAEGYYGNSCENVNPCTNNPCQNAGTCTVTGDDSYSCQCAEGYYGNSCEKVSPCNSSPCKNGASCIMTGEDSYSCNCTEEFEGETCESRRPCPPGKKTDNAEGRCCVFSFVYGGVSYDSCTKVNHNQLWCSLTAVYSGQWANCVNPCTNNPCQNAGTCTVTGDDSYGCQCAEGYYGDSCEKVSPCNSNPCKNGASCIMTGEDSYSCNCTEEFEGETCESRRPCPPGKKTDNAEGRCCVFPFVYGGVSYDSCTKVNYNQLWCSLTAVYSGQWANCVDECASSPCKNGASCKTTEDGYSCQPCPAGWKGKNCDEDINECEASPCKNGATCENQPGGYSCSCMSGYTGQNCEQDINECANDPCLNGATCHDGVGRYTCECPAGYEGTNCETDIDECEVDPCLNGATCVNSAPGSYTCNCAEGYKGGHCQEVIWNSEGCFKEAKKKKKRIFKKKFATVKGIKKKNPDIEKIYNTCKAKAEANGYEIFAIRGLNNCVTSNDGKLVDFKKYGASSKCKTNDQSLGVGIKKANFVYTR
ncbi:uncharacterized protein LOC144661095 [Oculina patagonica]